MINLQLESHMLRNGDTIKSAYESPYDEFVPKQNTTSLIWTYFGLEADEDGKLVSTETMHC